MLGLSTPYMQVDTKKMPHPRVCLTHPLALYYYCYTSVATEQPIFWFGSEMRERERASEKPAVYSVLVYTVQVLCAVGTEY